MTTTFRLGFFGLCAIACAGTLTVGCSGSGTKHSGKRATANGVGTAPVDSAQFTQTGVAGTGSGTVTVDPPSATGHYPRGTTLTITAAPAAGSLFAGWTGDFAGSPDNPLTVVLQSDVSIGATFDLPAPGAPVATFSTNPDPAIWVAPLAVTFTDTSSGAPTGYRWDFGDGATSTDPNPTHTYTQPGTYSVTLRVENANGPGLPLTRTGLVVVADPSEGSRYWYQNDTYGQPLKTHDAAEASLAQQVLTLVNQERTSRGLSPLAFDAEAERAAKAHVEDMDARNYFDHISPEGWDPGDRLQMTGASGYQGFGENIAVGQQTAQAVMTAWMNSAGHRANILEPTFTHLGVGVASGRPYWAQVFLTR